MFATVATWRVHESAHGADSGERLIRDHYRTWIASGREVGVLEILALEVEPDLLMGITIYESREDAEAALPAVRKLRTATASDTLALVNVASGEAYDPGQLVGRERVDILAGRPENSAMHASLVTWRLDPSIRSPEALSAYLHSLWERYVSSLHRLGLIDILVVRIAEDTILAIRLYASRIEGSPAYRETVAAAREIMAGNIEFIAKQQGRAFDGPMLLDSGT